MVVMVQPRRGLQHESDVLIRHLDGHLATLRTVRPAVDLNLAERIADTLRTLVLDTGRASAADRARVRAAVHFFVTRRDTRNERRPARPVSEDVRVVNEIVRALGRRDLVLSYDVREPEPALPRQRPPPSEPVGPAHPVQSDPAGRPNPSVPRTYGLVLIRRPRSSVPSADKGRTRRVL
jgi:hypothetical protein